MLTDAGMPGRPVGGIIGGPAVCAQVNLSQLHVWVFVESGL